MRISDWSSDVCSSDLLPTVRGTSRTCVTPSSFRRLTLAGLPWVANLRLSVVVSATVVRRYVVLEPATLRRHANLRHSVVVSPTVVRRYVVLEPATLRRHANLRHSVVVSPTVVRRFVGGLELATFCRRFGDCRSQVGGVLGSPARTIRTTVARTPPPGRGGPGGRPCRRGPGDR